MVLTNILFRKLSSLLRPWLRDEPELQLKLGIVNSIATLENFSLSALALDQLLKEDESSSLCIKEVNVEHLSIRFSNWSVPAFTLEVRGVHVALSVRERKEGSSRKDAEVVVSTSEDVNKSISAIDPEGCALHDVLKKIVDTTPSRGRTAISFLNLILNHCHLQILNFNLHLQFPLSHDSFKYILKIKELNAESIAFPQGCLLRGLISSLFLPLKESSFVINGSGFEIGYKRDDHENHVCISNELFSSVKFDKLKLVDFCIRIPDLVFSFSPLDLRVLAYLGKLSSKESRHASRNGRLLWKLVLRRIGYVIPAPSLSLHNLVELVSLWLRYVNAYETLLLLVGYPADDLLKGSPFKMSHDKMFLASVKTKWEVISDIEKELTPEAIAQARRIARYRAGSNVQHAEDSNKESLVYCILKSLGKIRLVLACIWKIMYRMFDMLLSYLYLLTIFTHESESSGNQGLASLYSCQKDIFLLNLGNISVHLFPENSVRPTGERIESQTETSYSDFFSMSLSIDTVTFIYVEDISEKALSISCGQMKVISSTFFRDHIMKRSSKTYIASPRGHRKGRTNNIMWGEPAQMFPFPETGGTIATGHDEGNSGTALGNLLGELWSNWKMISDKFEECEIEYSEDPWFLCEIKSLLTHPDRNSHSGLWKCNLAVGKLNLALEYSSILSFTLLLQQIKCALCWDVDRRSGVSSTVEAQPELACGKYESYANVIKTALLRMLPEKRIQVGLLIAGPHIQISSKKIEFLDSNELTKRAVGYDDFHLEFDVHDIEVVILPPLKSNFKIFTKLLVSEDAESECLRLQEPQIIHIPISENEKYSSQGEILLGAYLKVDGLDAYIADTMQNDRHKIFALKPITMQLSSVRGYMHSLTTAVTAFSAALGGLACGFMIVLFVDELNFFLQMMADFLSTVSDTFSSSSSVDNLPFEEYMWHDMISLEHEHKEDTLKGESLISSNTLFSLSGSFSLKSMGIVLFNSRKPNKIVSVQNIDVASANGLPEDLLDWGFWISARKISVDLFCEEEKADALIDLAGIRALMVKYEEFLGKCSDHVVLSNLLQQSQNCLIELFLSNCIFTLWCGSPLNTESDRVGGSNRGGSMLHEMEAPPLTSESNKPKVTSHRFVQELGFIPDIFSLAPRHWILINATFSGVLMARCSIKDRLVEGHQIDKFFTTLSVGGEFQTVAWGIQGGVLLLELAAMELFVRCFCSYLEQIEKLVPILEFSVDQVENQEQRVDRSEPNEHPMNESCQEALMTSKKTMRRSPESFTMEVSKFTLVLVNDIKDGSIWELVLEVDANVKLEMACMSEKFEFVISHFSLISQVLKDRVENGSEIPHFSAVTSNEPSSSAAAESSVVIPSHNSNGAIDSASCSSNIALESDFTPDSTYSGVLCLCHQNHILKKLVLYVSVEKLENHWVGSGSVSGFHMMISLSDLEMILSMAASFSGISSKEANEKKAQRQQSSNQEIKNSLKAVVPDNGAIVAIQDINQHTYFSVEGKEGRYNLAGAIHYSLVGERALFRVKHHEHRRWNSSNLWFSLISLYAKNDSGQPLRLNCRSGSVFVDISCSEDSGLALWKMFPCESESDQSDVDLEPHKELVKRTFYLVNKKNDSAVAFIDGVPEFVRKPGNPFKFKVFNNLQMIPHSVASETNLDAAGSNHLGIGSEDERSSSRKTSRLPCVDIKIDEVSLTIVHELLDRMDMFPLLRGCISSTQLMIQILPTKTRVINKSSALLSYFDAQKNLWREFIKPVEICIYYRSNFKTKLVESHFQRAPVHIYCKTKELEILLTELSLDILLFVIGKLDLAGPYLIRSTRILANSCGKQFRSKPSFSLGQSTKCGNRQETMCFFFFKALNFSKSKSRYFISGFNSTVSSWSFYKFYKFISFESSIICLENPNTIYTRFKNLPWTISCDRCF